MICYDCWTPESARHTRDGKATAKAIGMLTLAEENGILREIRFGEYHWADRQRAETETIRLAKRELEEYLRGERRIFTIPHEAAGTVFQKKVWKALEEIPYGEVRSYKEIAEVVGNPKACRAVGMANHENPLPIIVPCHRVVGADGRLTGYAGGLEKKKQLLVIEGIDMVYFEYQSKERIRSKRGYECGLKRGACQSI